jgi:hypothetical protein
MPNFARPLSIFTDARPNSARPLSIFTDIPTLPEMHEKLLLGIRTTFA